MGKDVFISYHGGYETGAQSSYSKACELKQFLENHEGQQFQCFLCKEENHDNYYDAIDKALTETRHFILVACNLEMLRKSKWVEKEVSTFDAFRLNGEKPHSVMNAYIFGDITPSELYNFRTVFVTQDIASGEGGFEQLYQKLVKQSANMPSENTLPDFQRMVCFTGHGDRMQRFLNTLTWNEPPRYLQQSIDDYRAYVDAEIARAVIEQTDTDGTLFLYSCADASAAANYLAAQQNPKLNAVIYDKIHPHFHVVANGKLLMEPLKELQIRLGGQDAVLSVLEGSSNADICAVMKDLQSGDSVLQQHYESGDIDQINQFIYSGTTPDAVADSVRVECNDFYYYLYSYLLEHMQCSTEETENSLEHERDLLAYGLSLDYDEDAFAETYIRNKSACLLSAEQLLSDYYHAFKRTKHSEQSIFTKLQDTAYQNIAHHINQFYTSHSPQSIDSAVSGMQEIAAELKRSGNVLAYSYLLTLFSEIYMHNIFVLGVDAVLDKNILAELRDVAAAALTYREKVHIEALILAFEKELVFDGHFMIFANSLEEAWVILLTKYDALIQDILGRYADSLPTPLKEDLILLYRQRCVIWEKRGDATLRKEERLEFYKKWAADCQEGIALCETIQPDQELFGCLYLNIASALNRLTADESTDNAQLLHDCLEYLDKTVELLKGSSAVRYLAYVYVHKSDCYEQILLLQEKGELGNYELTHAELVENMNRCALQAWRYLQDTTDNTGKGWTQRLMAKSMALKADLNSKNPKLCCDGLKRSLKTFVEAIHCCARSQFVKGFASCICDFSVFIRIIAAHGFSQQLSKEIIEAFTAETMNFAIISQQLELDLQEVIEVQNQMEAIFIKLLT